MKRLISLILVLFAIAIPAQARQLDCDYDAFGSSVDLVTFTPETDAQERLIVLAALDTTAYDTASLVKELGQPLRIHVHGHGSYSFPRTGTIVLSDYLNMSDLKITLMHEVGHVHDEHMLTDQNRQDWAWSQGIESSQVYNHHGWKAFDAPYFERPAEQYAFAFSRQYRPCEGSTS